MLIYLYAFAAIATIIATLSMLFPELIILWQVLFFLTFVVIAALFLKALMKVKVRWKFVLALTPVVIPSYFIVTVALPWISCRFLNPTTDITADAQEAFQPVANLPWINYGTDFGKVPAWSYEGISIKPGLTSEFAKLKKKGIKSVVWHLLADGGASPEFDSLGVAAGLDSTFWVDYDTAVEIADSHDIGIFWVLMDFKWFFPDTTVNGAKLRGHADAIIDTSNRRLFFERVLSPLVKRHPHNPHINGWIVINEPENAIKEGYIQPAPLREFITQAKEIIRKNTCNQRVTIGSNDLPSLIHYWSGLDLDSGIFHHYEKYMPPPVAWLHSNYPMLKNKNLINGEFFISKPVGELDRYIYWMRLFGYGGAWPWSTNSQDSATFDLLASEYSALVNMKGIADYSVLLSNPSAAELDTLTWWWQQLEVMRSEMIENTSNWATDRQTQSDALPINQRWLDETNGYIAEQSQHLKQYRTELPQAVSSRDQNQRREQTTRNRLQLRQQERSRLRTDSTTISERKEPYQIEISTSCVESMNILQSLNALENRLWNIASHEARQNLVETEFNAILSSTRPDSCATPIAKYQELIEWEIRTYRFLGEVQENIALEQANLRQANHAVQESQAWVDSLHHNISTTSSKLDTLYARRDRAAVAVRRCEALIEWASFHIDYASRILNDFIPDQLRRIEEFTRK